MSAIFISHSSKDNHLAGALRERLVGAGYASLFLDFHPEDGIPGGREWEEELYAQLRACEAVVVLCSKHSMSSKWCFAEITHAKALGKEIVPLRVGPCEIDSLLNPRQVVEYTNGSDAEFKNVLHALAARLDLAAGLAPGRAPYPGLSSFEEEDAAVFFGRDAEIQGALDLLNRVRRFGRARALVLLGSSGSGKSSVLKAGLVPRLRKVEEWLLVEPMRPLLAPVEQTAFALSKTFRRLGGQRDWRGLRDELLKGESSTLRDFVVDLRVLSDRGTAVALFAVDQAEDLLAEAYRRLSRDLTEEEWQQYVGDEPYRPTRVAGVEE